MNAEQFSIQRVRVRNEIHAGLMGNLISFVFDGSACAHNDTMNIIPGPAPMLSTGIVVNGSEGAVETCFRCLSAGVRPGTPCEGFSVKDKRRNMSLSGLRYLKAWSHPASCSWHW